MAKEAVQMANLEHSQSKYQRKSEDS